MMLFAMIFSVGFTYFYVTTTDQIHAEENVAQQNSLQSQQSLDQADLLVFGTVISNTLEFYINNTGPSEAIAAYWILNASTAKQLLYENSSAVCTSTSCTTINDNPPDFPLSIGQGQSTNPPIDTNLSVTSISATFVIKVVTTSGIVVLGAYPNQYTSTSSLESDVASGIGSALVSFKSFYWYDYVSGPAQEDSDFDFNNICANGVQCNGGSWIFDASHPHPGSLVPEGQNHTGTGCTYCGIEDPIVFSVNVTNEDSQDADIVINSQANLWIVETCDAGTATSHCGETSPVYVFYVVNVNPATGAILSTTKGSFTQINIPYGVTKTLYFASAYPVSLENFQYMSLGTDDSTIPGNNLAYYGQFAIFMLLPGTRFPPNEVLVYGQNIPFESTIAGDNIGWYSETPSICTGGTAQPFSLNVNDSWFSGAPINQVVLNASSFSAISPTAPTGWMSSVTNGIITWTNTNTNDLINPGGNLVFSWLGTAPAVNTATQEIFPLALYWNAGALTKLQGAVACFVNPGTPFPVPEVQPTGIVDYVPISLSNLQDVAVPGGTQIMLTLGWASYSSYLDNPVDNILFFDWSGHSLNAWMESGTSSSSTSIVWVKLNSSGINPRSSITIYMGFYATGTSHLSSSGPFGEAPQLSSTYGQYDDGSTVFSYYNNGKSTANLNIVNGGTIANGAQTNPYGGTSGVLTLTGSGSTSSSSETVAWYTSPVVGDDFIVEGWINIDTNLNGMFAVRGSTSTTNTNYLLGDGWTGDESSLVYESGTTNTLLTGAGTRNAVWDWDQATINGTALTVAVYSSQPYEGGSESSTATTTNSNLGAANQYLGIATWSGANSPALFYGWRARILPPNDVWPTMEYGPVFP